MSGSFTPLRLFEPEGAWCDGCFLREHCGSEATDQVCTPLFSPSGVAGPELLHPARPDFTAEFEAVGGVAFDDIVAQPQDLPRFGPYLPQMRWRSSLRKEALAPPAVAIRLDDVSTRDRIRSAAEFRQHVGLSRATLVVLLLFTYDRELEALAARGDAALDEIAAGGYAAVTSPSFSVWMPSRRPNNLLSLRRSMLTVEALHARAVPTIPRVAWVEPLDAERFAQWMNNNPTVDMVSIDLMGYQKRDFDRHTGLLAMFDRLTDERLHYLINGVNSFTRICHTYLAVAPERVTISDATLPRLPRVGANGKPQRGFRARVRASEDMCERARELVAQARRGSVEDVLSRSMAAAQRFNSTGQRAQRTSSTITKSL